VKNNVTALRLAGVAWRQSPDGWTRVTDPMPRARLVANARQSERIGSEILHIDPARVALLDRPLDDPSGEPGSARILVDRPGRIDVETSAPGRQLLVLTERFHPGWRATADGRELQTLSVYGTYLGCVVNPGTSRIQLVFAPQSLTVGIAVTLGGLVLTVAIAGVIGWSRGRARTVNTLQTRPLGPMDHRQGSSR
jgi:Bacterial membrane protein YfhO